MTKSQFAGVGNYMANAKGSGFRILMARLMDIDAADSTDNCWEWNRARDGAGYGLVGFEGKRWRVHRLVYHMLIEEIPDGYVICHRCDNPPCFRPSHLFHGTYADNNRDKMSKGRHRRVPRYTDPWLALARAIVDG